MKLTVTIPNGADPIEVAGTCQMGEFNADGRFDQPLVGDDMITRVMQAWVGVAPMERAAFVRGTDADASLVFGFVNQHGDHKGMTLVEVRVDDVTWLHGLDAISQMMPHPALHWEIELISAHPQKPAPIDPRHVEDLIRDDPNFWVDEHSDRL